MDIPYRYLPRIHTRRPDDRSAQRRGSLYIPSDCELLPVGTGDEGQDSAVDALEQMATEEQDADDFQHRQLLELIRLAGGKPLLLADNYDISAQALLESAAKADLTVFCPLMPHLEGQGVGELGLELRSTRRLPRQRRTV